MNFDNLVFGADPEFFIVEKIDNKEYAIPVPYFMHKYNVVEIGYDESRKHPVIAKEKNFKVIMDGVATELTLPPVKTAKEMYGNVKEAIDYLTAFANNFGFNFSTKPTVYYQFDRFYNSDDILFEQCGIFGCDPDEDAILSDYSSPEINVREHPFRYGGGHLHMSDFNTVLNKYPVPMIKLLAITCGNYSIASSKYPNLEKARMFKYGQPGRFRVQHYPNEINGIEYRSPSNTWISELDTTEGMFFWAKIAYEFLNDQDKAIRIMDKYINDTVEAITTVNQDLANLILSKIVTED